MTRRAAGLSLARSLERHVPHAASSFTESALPIGFDGACEVDEEHFGNASGLRGDRLRSPARTISLVPASSCQE